MPKPLLLCLLSLLGILMENCSTSQKTSTNRSKGVDSQLLEELFNKSDFFVPYVQNKKDLGIQVVYTQIDRKKNGQPVFIDHHFNLNDSNYFYPASTVKLPVAILALQKLNELHIQGLDKNSTMITGAEGKFQTPVNNDPSSADGRPTIAHYIKKILLVSDNDAFNRLYEFLGQEYINNSLHKMGYSETQIIHRLSVGLPDSENRFTNPVSFYDTSGNLIYSSPAKKSELVYALRNTKMGKGYMTGQELINDPFDFSMKNRLSLQTLHTIVRSIFFPKTVALKQRFNLTNEDYAFLQKYMSMRPAESASPVYSPKQYWDNYVKMIYYGAERNKPDSDIRIFNKTGTAYGFLVDAAYVVDYRSKIEFIVSAVIYCNSDQVFNDDKYDYEKVGYPFLKNLGKLLYQYELERPRKNIPDLTSIRFSYP